MLVPILKKKHSKRFSRDLPKDRCHKTAHNSAHSNVQTTTHRHGQQQKIPGRREENKILVEVLASINFASTFFWWKFSINMNNPQRSNLKYSNLPPEKKHATWKWRICMDFPVQFGWAFSLPLVDFQWEIHLQNGGCSNPATKLRQKNHLQNTQDMFLSQNLQFGSTFWTATLPVPKTNTKSHWKIVGKGEVYLSFRGWETLFSGDIFR